VASNLADTDEEGTLKNFDNLFAAWMFVWAVFFVYEISIARRMTRLRKELEELKHELDGRS
jgi:CcmD family protein